MVDKHSAGVKESFCICMCGRERQWTGGGGRVKTRTKEDAKEKLTEIHGSEGHSTPWFPRVTIARQWCC